MIQTKTTNAGPVGLNPKGDYSASETYTLLDCVKYNHDSWVCKAINADGSAATVTGQAPSDNSQYWLALTDGGRAAFAEGETAKSKGNVAEQQGNTAEQKGNDAQTKGNYAKEQGDYAKEQGNYVKSKVDEASIVNAVLNGSTLSVTSRNGSTVSTDLKGPKGDPGKDLDFASLTPSEKQELIDYITEKITSEGGYVMIPVDESTLSPSSTFQKNSIISIDGVVYRAKENTDTLPFPFLVEENKFVVQTMYGRPCFVKAGNTLSSYWEVYIDASNDVRYKLLEERVAHLETIINSL